MSDGSGTTGSTAVRWQWARLDELASAELYAALALRQRVFVVEQECVFQDVDGRDGDAWHLLGWSTAPADVSPDDAPSRGAERGLSAYARVFAPGARYPAASVGRIVTAPEARGTGLGRVLVGESLRRVAELWPGSAVKIEAQQRLQRFYEEFGFARTADEPYIEDGILHVTMTRAGSSGTDR